MDFEALKKLVETFNHPEAAISLVTIASLGLAKILGNWIDQRNWSTSRIIQEDDNGNAVIIERKGRKGPMEWNRRVHVSANGKRLKGSPYLVNKIF